MFKLKLTTALFSLLWINLAAPIASVDSYDNSLKGVTKKQ